MEDNIMDDIVGVDKNNCLIFKSLSQPTLAEKILAEKEKQNAFKIQELAFNPHSQNHE